MSLGRTYRLLMVQYFNIFWKFLSKLFFIIFIIFISFYNLEKVKSFTLWNALKPSHWPTVFSQSTKIMIWPSALNLKALINVSKVRWRSQLSYKTLRSSFEGEFNRTNFISPKRTPPKSPHRLGLKIVGFYYRWGIMGKIWSTQLKNGP